MSGEPSSVAPNPDADIVSTDVTTDPAVWTALAADVREGLSADQKSLPPKWFYDARGSELFDQICELDEYYPTRCEAALLADVGARISSLTGAAEVIELGAGSSTKSPLLLDPLAAAGTLERYVSVDVSGSAMQAAAPRLAARYPEVAIAARICDFTVHLDELRERVVDGTRLVAFLGSTIGNLQPVEVQAFLLRVRELLAPGDRLLLGHDLVKDVAVIRAAYNDRLGVTAAFNRNVLRVINRELQADFDELSFAHEATWNAELERVEIRLRSTREQTVRVAALDMDVPFASGEAILTEISRKFRRPVIDASARHAGLVLREWFQDADGWYGLSLLGVAD